MLFIIFVFFIIVFNCCSGDFVCGFFVVGVIMMIGFIFILFSGVIKCFFVNVLGMGWKNILYIIG